MKLKLLVSLGALAAGVAGCGGGGGSTPAPTPTPTPVPAAFAEVDEEARESFEAEGLDGMGLVIYDANGVKRFEKMYGDFSPDRRVAIASASKLVAGLTILRLVDQEFLSLDSTTGEVLGWTGPHADITLRQLLSFTSGMEREAACTLLPGIDLADCVQAISLTPLVATPGTRFDYGSTHLHVAARMAEVVTGDAWMDVFAQQMKEPLGLGADMVFYTAPRQASGTSNPLIAGGLRATMNEYARILRLEYDRGVYDGNRLIADALFDEQSSEPYPDAEIGSSPLSALALNFHYGLANWLECTPPALQCDVQSSAGAFGFTPWVDRTGGYYAILGMEVDRSQDEVVSFAVSLQQRLKPLIREELQK
jgi:CubicO group peptidase (beta-lactamase class C family)